MELKVDNLKKEIIQLDKKKADAELKVTRIDSVSNDIVEQNMTEYYETQVQNIGDRMDKIKKIRDTDKEQAVDYQKELFGFEKKYFQKMFPGGDE